MKRISVWLAGVVLTLALASSAQAQYGGGRYYYNPWMGGGAYGGAAYNPWTGGAITAARGTTPGPAVTSVAEPSSTLTRASGATRGVTTILGPAVMAIVTAIGKGESNPFSQRRLRLKSV